MVVRFAKICFANFHISRTDGKPRRQTKRFSEPSEIGCPMAARRWRLMNFLFHPNLILSDCKSSMNKQKFKWHRKECKLLSFLYPPRRRRKCCAIRRRRQCRLMFAYFFLSPSAAHPRRKRKQTSFDCLTIFTATVFIFCYPFNHIVSGRPSRRAVYYTLLAYPNNVAILLRLIRRARRECALDLCPLPVALRLIDTVTRCEVRSLFSSNSVLSARRSPALRSVLPFRIRLP